MSLLCCVSMWNFRAGPDWKTFPQTPHGGSAGLVSPPWLGWASLMCWFTQRNQCGEKIYKKIISFGQFHLRHSVEDILATKTEECCVCVSVQIRLQYLIGHNDIIMISISKYFPCKLNKISPALIMLLQAPHALVPRSHL